jgi:hypothetical protein
MPCLKPPLTEKIMHDRVVLAELGLTIATCRIVFIDEMWCEFNNSQRHRRKQTRRKDENPYDCPRPEKEKEPGKRVMFTSAINRLCGKAPGYIYPKASNESKKKNQETAKIVNAER